MGQRTPLYDSHLAADATIVDFAGWDMPVHYGSQIEEHHAVRRAAGMFDVSHMTVIDMSGTGATGFLRRMLANDVARLQPGRALYSVMCNQAGGVRDDLIVYRTTDGYRLVVNSATRHADLKWLKLHLAGDVTMTERTDLAMIAIQGPRARELAAAALGGPAAAAIQEVAAFHVIEADDLFIAGTGYTGEDGIEIILPASLAPGVWEALRTAGVQPCGLGARDTLRLEAGMALYGQDMTAEVSPLSAGLGWTIAWKPTDRDFIGREALQQQRADRRDRFVGLVLQGRGVMRSGQAVHVPGVAETGVVTSGTFSPTLGVSIALARLPTGTPTGHGEHRGPQDEARAKVDIRNHRVPARVIRLPFVRHGEQMFPSDPLEAP